MSKYNSLIQTGINSLGYYEIGGAQLDSAKSSICKIPYICRIMNGFLPKASIYNDPDRITWIRNRPFAGASIRQITHFLQEVSNKRFCSFGNGADYNLG